jgi:hypothetical protein
VLGQKTSVCRDVSRDNVSTSCGVTHPAFVLRVGSTSVTPAHLLAHAKALRGDGSIVEVVIRELPESVTPCPHRYKYRLFFGTEVTPERLELLDLRRIGPCRLADLAAQLPALSDPAALAKHNHRPDLISPLGRIGHRHTELDRSLPPSSRSGRASGPSAATVRNRWVLISAHLPRCPR